MRQTSIIFALIAFVGGMIPFAINAQDGNWQEENWQDHSSRKANFESQFPNNTVSFPKADSFTQPTSSGIQQVGKMPVQTTGAFRTNMDLSPQPLSEALASKSEPDSGWSAGMADQFAQIEWPKVVGSLAVVLGGYFGFVWMTRKISNRMPGELPADVIELVGTKRLTPKQNLQLVRLGSKLLLLVNGDEGTNTVAEVTDPAEVEYLTSLCKSKSSGGSHRSASAAVFRRALDRTRTEGQSSEAALDKVIRKLTELAGSPSRTNYEA